MIRVGQRGEGGRKEGERKEGWLPRKEASERKIGHDGGWTPWLICVEWPA